MSYSEYLKTKRWKSLADHCRAKAGNQCEMCGDKESKLDAHHMRYDNLMSDHEQDDLCCLCYVCHGMYHSVVKIPKGRRMTRLAMMDALYDTLNRIGVNVAHYNKKYNRESRIGSQDKKINKNEWLLKRRENRESRKKKKKSKKSC